MQAFMQIFFAKKIPNLRYCASGGWTVTLQWKF